jgi:predicted RNase H-like nuclease (RuvC/YqgF family)
MVHDAKVLALKQEKRRLENEVEISRTQIALFEKEVDKRKEEADNAGRITISAQMAKADIENIERVLRNVAEEGERLRVELKSGSRVTALPAELPESSD